MRLPILLFALAFAGCAQAQTPTEIADGRSEQVLTGGSEADLSVWENHAAVQRAMATARAHWQAQDAGYEEDVRFFGVAEGAFTRPRTTQHAVLFVMSVWPRCCPKTGLAVIEGDRLVRNVAFEGTAQDLAAVPDLDGDGLDELAYAGFFGMGGSTSGSVTLVGFAPDSVRTWGGTSILEDACAAMQDGSTAARLLALPGPTFTVERYTQSSCETATWESVGPAEPLELEPYGDAFVELGTD